MNATNLRWVIVGLLLWSWWSGKDDSTKTPPADTKTALIVFVGRKEIGPPLYALGAIKQLRDAGRDVRLADDDPKTGLGTIPKEVQPAMEPARAAGLPAVVLLQGDRVLKAIKLPETSEAILEAVK